MEVRKLSHCAFVCDYHIVLLTKYRKKIFDKGIFEYFQIKLTEIRKYYPVIEIKEINHDKDHIHMLISIPPTISVEKVVRIIKSNTGKKIREKFPFLKKVYWGIIGIWSDRYFVSTVGLNEDMIKKYIQMQEKEDIGQTKFEI
ncbi:MAG: IS200/IS605-like element ISSsu4 family transposase [Candidatus Microgenomates bacterium]